MTFFLYDQAECSVDGPRARATEIFAGREVRRKYILGGVAHVSSLPLGLGWANKCSPEVVVLACWAYRCRLLGWDEF